MGHLRHGRIGGHIPAVPLIGYLDRCEENPMGATGPVTKFPQGETGWNVRELIPSRGRYDRAHRRPRSLLATANSVFAMNCTHLGCPVTWFPQSGLFMCPCRRRLLRERRARLRSAAGSISV